jgi:feruloyl esterase
METNMKSSTSLTALFGATFTASLLVTACGGGDGSFPAAAAPPPAPVPPVAEVAPAAIAAPGSLLGPLPANKQITAADCDASKLGTSIDVALIGEPVASVTLATPTWTVGVSPNPSYCTVNGVMAPVDTSATAKPINFRVVLPASWSYRAAQQGGGGMNGSIPGLTGTVDGYPSFVSRGWAVSGSDSGHTTGSDWALNDEAMRNLAYMQMKKTHDAAWVLIQRMYGQKPRFSYWYGGSQGGREGLTVVQRYPADYDGVIANVPIVNFSSLMLGPELIRIQEKPLANWVTQAKRSAISAEVMRQCDKLDGLVDGVINNYQACRAIFDVNQGTPGRKPWAAIRCPNNVDPNPADTSAAACLTDGQISTLQFTHTRYRFATPLANGVTSFGMWLPGTDPGGSGLIESQRFQGQEGATGASPVHSQLGILGVTGFLFQDLNANPLDYVEGGSLNARRVQISQYLDATNPDLSAFYKRGGKLISMMATNDTLASPAAQLDYYQSVHDRMGTPTVDMFARLYVVPGAGHGMSGNNYTVNGDGEAVAASALASTFDRISMLTDWVENNRAPDKTALVFGGTRTLPLCSYPMYPRYKAGPLTSASSYTCTN